MKAIRIERDGHYLRVSAAGQLVLDACPSDQEHLVNPTSQDGERPTCRTVLANEIPRPWLGKKGSWIVTIAFREGEDPEPCEDFNDRCAGGCQDWNCPKEETP